MNDLERLASWEQRAANQAVLIARGIPGGSLVRSAQGGVRIELASGAGYEPITPEWARGALVWVYADPALTPGADCLGRLRLG